VLITGASGFIGSHLVEEGLARGYHVYAAIRKSSSCKYLQDKKIRIIYLDFSSKEQLKFDLSSLRDEGIHFDFVIHNAGITKANRKEDFRRINYVGTKHFVEALIELKMVPDKFVFISSLAASGPGDPISMQPITGDITPHPIDPYGRSKLAAEQFLQSRPGFPYLIIRPTGVYGPREQEYLKFYRIINKGLEPYIGSSHQQISFIYIRDLVMMVFDAAASSFVHKTWVASDGKNYSTMEFANLVKKILRRKTVKLFFPLKAVKVMAVLTEAFALPFRITPTLNRDKISIIASKNWRCDPSTIFKDLQFTPEYDLEKGLRETL